MRHITDIGALSDKAIREILEGALAYDRAISERQPIERVLEGCIQYNLFYENSTRTSLSFVVAASRLGVHAINVPVAASSVHKGESVRDTVQTLAAHGADFMVLRAEGAGTIDVARTAIADTPFRTALINGGEGVFGHPTQALLDVATLLKATRRAPGDGLDGLIVAIVGDLEHSRVAVSCTQLFSRLGAEVRLCGPEDLQPQQKMDGVSLLTSSRDEALDGADVVMALRVQQERFSTDMPVDPRTYRADYGLSMEALSFAKPTAFVMHPGPMNRGIEIDHDVAEDRSRSLVLAQVAMGVPTRMACLTYAAEI